MFVLLLDNSCYFNKKKDKIFKTHLWLLFFSLIWIVIIYLYVHFKFGMSSNAFYHVWRQCKVNISYKLLVSFLLDITFCLLNVCMINFYVLQVLNSYIMYSYVVYEIAKMWTISYIKKKFFFFLMFDIELRF